MDYFSLTDIKKKNRYDVFHYIYQNSGCSKQAIANALTMSLPTVSQHLLTLQEEGLIEKTGQLSSSIGRKATAYAVISTARIAMGIEILSNKAYLVILDLYGQKKAKEKISLCFEPTDQYFETLKNKVMTFLSKNQFELSQLLGIGLAMQGLVSQDGSHMTYGKILNCTGLSIEPFARFFDCPCRFIHDPECAASSELWENKELTNAIYMSLGLHLGGAIILDGKLQRGLSGKTGTFEHMTLIPSDKKCYCGKTGCAECYCSASALLDGEMELEEFFARKSSGDTVCLQKWDSYLDYLAMLINNLHMVLENTVVLGGHITPYFTEEDISALRAKVAQRYSFGGEADYILAGKCRHDAVSMGAGLPFIEEFLANPEVTA